LPSLRDRRDSPRTRAHLSGVRGFWRFVRLRAAGCGRLRRLPVRPLSADDAQATPAILARGPERSRGYSGRSPGRRRGC